MLSLPSSTCTILQCTIQFAVQYIAICNCTIYCHSAPGNLRHAPGQVEARSHATSSVLPGKLNRAPRQPEEPLHNLRHPKAGARTRAHRNHEQPTAKKKEQLQITSRITRYSEESKQKSSGGDEIRKAAPGQPISCPRRLQRMPSCAPRDSR